MNEGIYLRGGGKNYISKYFLSHFSSLGFLPSLKLQQKSCWSTVFVMYQCCQLLCTFLCFLHLDTREGAFLE